MISDLKENSHKQINEIRTPIQDLNKQVTNMEEKFSKGMEIMKNSQVEILEIKTSINQIKTHSG
jgi:uncharacterized coiled-coil DUF342 family protein